MPQVFKRPRAETDLLDIWSYIAQDSPANADRMLNRIGETMNRLVAMPLMGQARFDLVPGLRMFPARFCRQRLKGLTDVPQVMITDQLASDGAAKRELLPSVGHRQHR
jgi:plasmid stabilization system protein ParE